VTAKMNRRDLIWIALIAISYAFGLAVSWQRWGNPLVDCGREMNQPLRLATGEMLYSDVRHIYGPLSPYLHALLFRLFGPSLNVLYADGIITAALIFALTYWLSRQVMSRAASAAATLTVMWLCTFKQAGNYILPYSYGALHGSLLGLATLALLIRTLRGRSLNHHPSPYAFALAGLFAGLATLAKTEMGLAALVAGIAAGMLVVYPNLWRGAKLVACFLAPAVVLIVGVYGYFVARVGWYTLSSESWLFLRNLAPELVYFNKRMSGFNQPGQSLLQIFGALVKLGGLAAIIASISYAVARLKNGPQSGRVTMQGAQVTDAGRTNAVPVAALLVISILALLVLPLAFKIDWDKGPYLAMPLLLAAFLVVQLYRFQKEAAAGPSADQRTVILIVFAVYALASLARIILRVRSGGAYSSYLLPASVVMFTYGWVGPFAAIFKDTRTRRLARNIALFLIFADVIATAGLLAYRFRTQNTVPIVTARGTIIAEPEFGQAWNEALPFIEQQTTPQDAIAVMPEGTSLNFFSGRRNPLREEITTPGFLDEAGEERAIRKLRDADTKLIFITNRLTSEFGPAVFGRDYCGRLMGWVEENYQLCAVFGPNKNPDLQIGDRTFFIRAYCRKANH
jgi:hypothetical protein